jgi:signal transduction histidine kinase/CheY-like chemotaxis protein
MLNRFLKVLRKKNNYLLFLLFTLLLVICLIFTQTLTDRANYALQKGNIEAVETFQTSNEMQRLINLSFTMQAAFSRSSQLQEAHSLDPLIDSLTLFGYNADILNNTILKKGEYPNLSKLMGAVDKQLDISYAILNAKQKQDEKLAGTLTDSLKKIKPGNDVYTYGVLVKDNLEQHLKQTLKTNNDYAGQLSFYNRILVIAAVIAILIFITIIIVHQWQQSVLINELRVAREAAEKSTNAKDDFLANMSHELRTPLNSLIGFGNLLLDSPLNNAQREYSNIIVKNGHHLMNIVDDILDFSSIEAGKLRKKDVPFKLNELFEELESMFSTQIQDKKLYYKWKINGRTFNSLKGDVERLKRILVNLINNAIKFTKQGGIDIHVSMLSYESESSVKLRFSIKDTGPGIPKEKIAIVFDRFEQLGDTTTRQHGGTGLGLSIVKSLVENMGGTVFVNSEVGVGSVFIFTGVFDILKGETEAVNKNHVKISADFSGYTALVAEDNAANRLLIKRILEKHRLNVVVAENGKIAVEKIQNNHYDIILMDIQMPQMDGYNAISVIRNDLKISTPSIAITAYTMEKEMKHCLKVGFDDHITKPIHEDELVNKISKYLLLEKKNNHPSLPVAKQIKAVDFFKEFQDDESSLKEFLFEMKDQWEKDKTDLMSAVRKQDSDSASRVLHRMKSTFTPLGPDHIIIDLLKEGNKVTDNKENMTVHAENFVKKIDKEASAIFID